MTTSPTQPEPAEGPRKDGIPDKEKGSGQGVSATAPAEGADDIPADNAGSVDGASDRAG